MHEPVICICDNLNIKFIKITIIYKIINGKSRELLIRDQITLNFFKCIKLFFFFIYISTDIL